jgi:hypothetical protein
MTFVIWGIVAILLLLILMKLPATANLFLTPMKPTSERRRKKDRRIREMRVRVERRHHPRRLEDQAKVYVDRIAKKQGFEGSKSS